MDQEVDDGTLMLRYRDGDTRAFESLYERHKGPLYRYLLRMSRSPDTANDLFQEAWSRVILGRDRYEVRAQFSTYLFRIAHNCAIDHFRRAGRRGARELHDADDAVGEFPDVAHEQPDAQLAEAQLRAEFRRALDRLPPEQRDVFVLYEESGLSLDAIGEVTGVPMETAKSRLRYALGKLRAALRHHQPETAASGAEGSVKL